MIQRVQGTHARQGMRRAPIGSPRRTPQPSVRRVTVSGPRRSMQGVGTIAYMPTPGVVDGLGFSLKPPKAIRKIATAIKKKVTLKNVLKVGAIVGATALIPGALPLLARGAIGGAKLARGVVRYGMKNVKSAGNILRGGSPGSPPIVSPQASVPFPDLPTPDMGPGPSATVSPPPSAPDYGSGVPASSGGGGGGPSAAAGDESPIQADAPAAAGIGGGTLPLLLLGAGAVYLASRRKRVRRAS